MSMGTTKMKMKDLGEGGGKEHPPGASIQSSRVPPRQLSHSSKIPNDSLSKPLAWLCPSSS
jgi:hypothetical protein